MKRRRMEAKRIEEDLEARRIAREQETHRLIEGKKRKLEELKRSKELVTKAAESENLEEVSTQVKVVTQSKLPRKAMKTLINFFKITKVAHLERKGRVRAF